MRTIGANMFRIARLARSSLLLLSAFGATAGAAPPRLEGEWAGERLRLVADADGLRLDGECWSGGSSGAVSLDRQGRFERDGRIEQPTLGQAPQAGDAGVSTRAARISGRLDGTVLHLSVTPAGAPTQRFELRRGAAVKLLRCL
jgi:hypothetical protein